METLAHEPANAESTVTAETGQVDSDPVAKSDADPAPAAADTGKPERDRVQDRIDQLTREKYEALGGRDSERYRREQLEQRLAELERTAAKTQTVAPSNEFPTLEQFGWDEAKYQAAVTSYWDDIADAKVAAALAKTREEQQRGERHKSWSQREADFIKSKPEYVEKVRNAQYLPISEELQVELQDSELGPQVALYLVENREKAQSIMALPLKAQLREIGRIEAHLESLAKPPAPTPVSKAPPPVAKVEGAAAVVDKDPADMSDREFKRWRDKQIAQRR